LVKKIDYHYIRMHGQQNVKILQGWLPFRENANVWKINWKLSDDWKVPSSHPGLTALVLLSANSSPLYLASESFYYICDSEESTVWVKRGETIAHFL